MARARHRLAASALLARWRRLPHVDPDRLRADLDAVLDSSGERTPQGLLNTSTVILLPQLDDAAVLPGEPLISTITLG